MQWNLSSRVTLQKIITKCMKDQQNMYLALIILLTKKICNIGKSKAVFFFIQTQNLLYFFVIHFYLSWIEGTLFYYVRWNSNTCHDFLDFHITIVTYCKSSHNKLSFLIHTHTRYIAKTYREREGIDENYYYIS